MSEFIMDNIDIILLALSFSVLAIGVKLWITRHEIDNVCDNNANYEDRRG